MMLQQFGDEIWIAPGPTVSVAGFDYPTRMAVIRLSGGELFIWSPVALSTDLRAAVDRLGSVRHVIAPNTLHHRFINEWRAAYPTARFHASPELRTRRPDLMFDDDLGDTPAPEWSGDVDQVVVRGNRITSEVVFYHRRSRTIIFTDLIQHFGRGWFTGWRAAVARLDLLTAPEPTVPRKFRIAFLDRGIAQAAIQRILNWPAEKVLMAHGAPVERDGRAVVARAFNWLLR
jgi:hypothetical protein